MAVPTVSSFLSTYHHPPSPATKTWTHTQGSASALIGAFWRDSQYVDASGSWGGQNLSGAVTASGSSGMGIAGRVHYCIPTTKSGDTRSVYSQWGDEQQYCDLLVTSSGPLSIVDTAKYEWNGSGNGTKSLYLDPNGYDCIVFMAALIENNGSGWSTFTVPTGETVTHHLSGNVINSNYTRIATAPWPASAGGGNVTISQTSQYHDTIVLAVLMGTPANGPMRKHGFTVVGA